MSDEIIIRRATTADAAAISHVVVTALHETNARDYTAAAIDEFAEHSRPADISAAIVARDVFVAVEADGATEGDRIVGTAGLEGARLRMVYVLPDRQAKGIGRRLIAYIEALARARGLPSLRVHSSITAEEFYRRLGFTATGEERRYEARLVIMTKQLSSK